MSSSVQTVMLMSFGFWFQYLVLCLMVAGGHNCSVRQRVNILDEFYLLKDSCGKIKTLEILSSVSVKPFFKY